MNFSGKYEQIIESTLGRFQTGGLLVGDIVMIRKNALNHPKIKEMGENVKGNIKMMMDTDLHKIVTGIRSLRDSRGDMSDGLGLATTTAPSDFWVDIAVLHSPGLKSDPITLPIEILERIDYGVNLPPIPDSLKRKGHITIKPEDVSEYDNNKGDKYSLAKESIEDVYSNMQQKGKNVTVRIPLEDSEETKALLDQAGVTYSLIGPNRFELHGTMDNINNCLNQLGGNGQGGVVDIEFVGTETPIDTTQQIPTNTGLPNEDKNKEEQKDNEKKEYKNENENLEEAYAKILNKDKTNLFTIEIGNAFADNIKTYLTQEGINSTASINGNKTHINIITTSDKETVEEAIRQNVLGDLTYLRIYNSTQQISESK